jgi:HK97 family phage major capsid protein
MFTAVRDRQAVKTHQELMAERARVLAEGNEMLEKAESAKRDLTLLEAARFQELIVRADDLLRELEAPARPDFDPRLAQGDLFGSPHGFDPPGARAVLGREERMTDWVARRGRGTVEDENGHNFSLGIAIRGMVTGRWEGGEFERRVLSEGTDSQGGFLIPEPLSARLIDRVRNAAKVFQAGVTTVPMEVDQLSLARLTGGASVAWKVENDPITASDMTFDRVTLRAHTLPILVRLSQELWDDLRPEAAALIENEMAHALALELDRVVLRGTGVDPQPKGIRNQTGVVLQSLGANGGTPSWDTVIDGVANVRNNNGEPNAILLASRTVQTLGKTKDSQQRYLDPPAVVSDIPRLVTNQIPTNLTVGTSTDTSEVYTGDWSTVLVGMRTQIRVGVRVLRERYADNLQIGLLSYLRADVAMAHPELFNVTTGVRP